MIDTKRAIDRVMSNYPDCIIEFYWNQGGLCRIVRENTNEVVVGNDEAWRLLEAAVAEIRANENGGTTIC